MMSGVTRLSFSSPQGWAGRIISADQGLSSQSSHQDARENGLQTAGLLDPGQCSQDSSPSH